MRKLLLIAVLGVGALGLMLAMPAKSEAGDIHFSIGVGPTYRPAYGGYYGNGYNYGRYGGYCNDGYYGSPGYSGYYRPGVIVHPERLHWTPYRGLHTHGHIHVPHRGHYHTRPY